MNFKKYGHLQQFDFLDQLFPDLKIFAEHADGCQICLDTQKQNAILEKSMKQQKSLFKTLLGGGQKSACYEGQTLHLVSQAFKETWVQYISMEEHFPSGGVDNQILMCQKHGKSVYDPNEKADRESMEICLIPDQEWLGLLDL